MQNLFSLHDCLHPHGDRIFRYFIDTFEKAGIVLNCFLLQCNFVGHFVEAFIRLIKSDVACVSKAEQLQIDSAKLRNQPVIPDAFR